MLSATEVQNLRQKSGDSAVFNHLLSDPEFKMKVDRVQQANPNMTDFEKMKFPGAMIDIYYKNKPKTTMDATASILNNAMDAQKNVGKGAWETLTEDPLVFAGQTLKNVLPSTGRLIGGVASAIAHPLQTGKTLFQLGIGGAANTLESIASLAGVRNAEEIFDLESEDVAKAVGDFYVQRYGSLENAATTLRDDPAGFLSDLGAVVTGVGGVIKGGATALGSATGEATKAATSLSSLGRGIRVAQSVGEKMIRTGINMEPLVITGKGVILAGRGIRNATKAATAGMVPDVMVTKALKVNPSEIQAFTNMPGNESMGSFLMRKGILSGGTAEIGEKGVQLMGSSPVGRTRIGIMDDLEKIFNKALSTVDNELSGVRQTYDILDDVPTEVPKLLDQIYTVAKKYDLADETQFIESLLKKERVTLSELNRLKRTAYDLFRTYKNSNVPADSFAAKQINQYERALRKFIEDQARAKGLPDIGALNEDIMKSREILDAMEKADAASMSKGKLTFGLMDGMFVIGAYSLTQDFMTTAGIVMGRKIRESTLFKTTFAKYLNRLDPRNIEILDKAFKSLRHTKESKAILRKVVAQTADDIKNKRIGEEEISLASNRPLASLQDKEVMPIQSKLGTSIENLPEPSPSANTTQLLPDELSKKFPNLTEEEIKNLTPEERSLGTVGGSDSVGGYRSAHQIDTKTAAPITKIDEGTLSSFIEEFKRQYGYPALKSKEVNKLKSIMSNPDADVKIYRASPKNELNNGDWVTIDKNYANDIKAQNGGKVYKYTVKAEDLFYPQTLEGFDNLPSLNKWGAFQFNKSTKSPLPNPLGGSDTLAPLMKEARTQGTPIGKIPFEKEVIDRATFKSPNKKDVRYSYTDGEKQMVINYNSDVKEYFPYYRDIKTGKQTPFYRVDKTKTDGRAGFKTLDDAKSQLIDLWNKANSK